MRRVKPVIVHIIWAVAGSAVGATAALLWVKKFKVEWVEAMGTWFGAIATVLALLWAVQTFRSDQAHREQERIAREVERAEEARAALRADEEAERRAEGALLSLANGVSVAAYVHGGGTPLRGGGFEITMLRLKVINETSERVLVKGYEVDPPLHAFYGLRDPLPIGSHDMRSVEFTIKPVDVTDAEWDASQAIERFVARLTYTVAGHTWTRDSTGAPARMVETGNHD
jgi:hypothetical protein